MRSQVRSSAGLRGGDDVVPLGQLWRRTPERPARQLSARATAVAPVEPVRTSRRSAPQAGMQDVLGIGRGTRLLLITLLSVGVVHVVFMLGVESLRFFRAQADITRLESEVGVLEGEAAQLQLIIDHAFDERYREQLARRQGFMYPDEGRVITSEPAPVPGHTP